jgi:hypothetical protein
MNRFIRSLFLLSVLQMAVHAQEQTGTSTVTLGVGGGWPLGNHTGITGGPHFDGGYEYRLRKYLALEFGIDTTVVNVSGLSPTYIIPGGSSAGTSLLTPTYTFFSAGARSTAMPFGVRGILPLSGGRVELAAGAGGAYLWNPALISSPSHMWGAQANLGARVAIDKQEHFWLGTTGRLVQDYRGTPRQWLTWTADLGFRFGH